MVLNADKCHYMCLGKDLDNAKFYFDKNTYVNNNEEKALGNIIDNALLFESHIKEVCRKVSQRPAALSRLPNYKET